jgi:ribokinase
VKDICIAGNLNIDLIIRNVPKLPEWGQEVAGNKHIAVSSGQGGYIALALSHLGTPVRMVGNLAGDPFGNQILDDLHKAGVDISDVEVLNDCQTGITVAIVRSDGERAFVSDFGCSRRFTEDLLYRHWSAIRASEILCFVGIFCLSNLDLDGIAHAMEKAHREGIQTMLDTGWDPNNWQPDTLEKLRQVLAQTDIFIPNLDEAQVITGIDTPQDAVERLHSYGVKTAVIKLGAKGSLGLSGDQLVTRPIFPARIYDTVGAGDVYDAGFLTGYRSGWTLSENMAFGSAAASLYLSREQDRYPSFDEVQQLIEQQ